MTTTTSSSLRNLALFSALGLVWGSAFLGIKIGLDTFPPILFAGARFILASLVLTPIVILMGIDLPRTWGDFKHASIAGVFVIAGYHGLLFWGEQYVTSSLAAIIVASNPILTAMLAYLLLPEEKLGVWGAVGVAMGFLGVYLLVGPRDTPSGLLGAVAVFAAAVSFALGSTLTKKHENESHVLGMTALQMWIGGLLLIGAGLIWENTGGVGLTLEGIGALVYLAVACSVLGFSLFFYLIGAIGVARTNLVSYVTPGIAVILGWLWLGETIGAREIGGLLVVLMGFTLVQKDNITRILQEHKRETT